MDVFVRVTATAMGGSRSCATETVTPPLTPHYQPVRVAVPAGAPFGP